MIIVAEIFGKDLDAIRGRALRQKPMQMQIIFTIKAHDALKHVHHKVRLLIDVLFVNGFFFPLTAL